MKESLDGRPPCWEEGKPCPNACAEERTNLILRNHVYLHGPWAGWRLAGRDLVSPDGVRLNPGRVLGLAWREHSEQRLARMRNARLPKNQLVKVVVIQLSDLRDRFGRAAG
jgi:hypothetical protein